MADTRQSVHARPSRPEYVDKPRRRADASRVLADLDAAFDACGLRDGSTLSFHHHLRNGDAILNMVLDAAARRGLRDLHVAASSIFPVHAPLVAHIRSGVVSDLSTSFISGPVGAAITAGLLPRPVTLTTHGGRAQALASGALRVDAAFVAAPSADPLGNLCGTQGAAAFGAMGYALCDVAHAAHVVAVTDTLAPFPLSPVDIPQERVDHVVVVPSIGDPSGIASGTTRPATDPLRLAIGQSAAAAITASGLLRNGFSFQTGAGGISLAAAAQVGAEMTRRGITGSFASGGITGFHVKMLRGGLFRTLLDVQCFDLAAVQSIRDDPRHQAMSAAAYAAPHPGGAVVDRLDAVILGAAEVDLDFNVNVTTNGAGQIIGGSGGHADTASGARLTVITTQLTGGGYPKIVPKVLHRTTPGHTVDLVVTEAGIAVNPARAELADRLRAAGLPLVPITVLAEQAAATATHRQANRGSGRDVAVSTWRDGSVTDRIQAV
ncbi:citrate lyase subunit alpha [Puniceibacterium sp. IMCC21224]|uniref:citrate lyase subunit alpha n=1 Tax=Puniceibacterium sp. IMCC21224 TaxID=1618204 RepID=UPI0012E07C9E|nr:citrate lyase subunit alpha [Puniceibacterium sp. IMCC21224]